MTVPVSGGKVQPRHDDGATPHLSLVIPTFNEADNITELLAQLSSALPAGLPAEIIFVDDSTDGTPAVIREAARHCRLPVSVLHRRKPARGLGGAVAAGLSLRHVVMLRFASTRAGMLLATRNLLRISERGPDRPHLIARSAPPQADAELSVSPTTR